MISVEDRIMLGLITVILDIAILKANVRSKYDKIWQITVIVSHIAFYIGLILNNQELLDYLHIMVFLTLGYSPFLESRDLKKMCLGLLITIQLLWLWNSRCILSDPCNDYGYGNEVQILTGMLTVMLIYILSL
tara:strand:- start:154 stop:552 length:399 start_codon:yes stop_codon:yes gene_type:complete